MAAPFHNVALKLTVDAQAAVDNMAKVEKEIARLIRAKQSMRGVDNAATAAIDAEILKLKEKQLAIAKTAGLVEKNAQVSQTYLKDLNAATMGNGRFMQSFVQLGYGVEDFAAVYGTMGLQGALRASGNNFSMVARIIAGPLYGSIIGAALVAFPLLMKSQKESTELNKKLTESLNEVNEKFRDQLELRHKIEDLSLKQSKKLRDLGEDMTAKEIAKESKKVQDDLDEINSRISQILVDMKEKADQGFGNLVSPNAISQLTKNFKGLEVSVIDNVRGIINTLDNEIKIDPKMAVNNFQKSLLEELELLDTALSQNKIRSFLGPAIDKTSTDDLLMMLDRYRKSMKEMIAQTEGSGEAAAKIAKEATDLASSLSEKTQEKLNLEEQLLALKNKTAVAEKNVGKEADKNAKAAAKALQAQIKGLDVLQHAANSNMQSIVQGVVDQEKKLLEAFNATDKTPVDHALFNKALDNTLIKEIKKLKEIVKGQTDTYKDSALGADNQREGAALAMRAAEAQIRAAESKDKDGKIKDVVDALKVLNDALKSKTLVAVPVG